MRSRLTRFEILLLVALALGTLAQMRISAQSVPGKGRAAWQEQEKQVQERIERTFSGRREEIETKIKESPALWWRFQFAFYLFVVIAASVLYQVVRAAWRLLGGRPVVERLGEPPPAAWDLRDILRIVVVGVVLSQAALLAEWWAIQRWDPGWMDRHFVALSNTLLLDGVVLAGACALLVRRGGRVPELWPAASVPSAWAAIRSAVRAYLAFLPLLLLILWGVAALLEALNLNPAPQAIFTLYLAETRVPVLAWLLVLVTVAGPVAEEFFFRGLVHGWLRGKIGPKSSILASSLFFAMMHNDPVAFFPILGLGILFGSVYELTGTLAAPVAVHVLHNGGMLFFASLVKTLAQLGGNGGA